MKKVFNKNVLLALLTTTIMVFLIVASSTSALAFTSDKTNAGNQDKIDVNYQFGYGEPGENLPEGTTDIRGSSATDGRFLKDVNAYSADGFAYIHIPSGTIGLDTNLKALTAISSEKNCVLPDAPAGYVSIGCAYDFGPSGSTFDPAVTVTVPYDSGKVPAGVKKDKLTVWMSVKDQVTGKYQWKLLKNNSANAVTVSGETNEFTLFAPFAPIPATTPVSTSAAPAPTSETTNWALVGSLIAVGLIILVLLGVYFLRLRKQST